MAVTESLTDKSALLVPLRALLLSGSVISKQAILDRELAAGIIDDHHLYDEEGVALISAFKNLGAKTINWCRTSDLMDPSLSADIHIIDCTYEGLLAGYRHFDDSMPYWDHILFQDSLNAIVLHTAHDHIIYVGPETFVNEATQRQNEFTDGWLAVIGQAFYDPELIAEYGLRKPG